jgi:hypothetical protein
MRSVHLTHLSEASHFAAYRPTSSPGAALVVEFVPSSVTDHEVARMASSRCVVVPLGQRRVVAFASLERRSAPR